MFDWQQLEGLQRDKKQIKHTWAVANMWFAVSMLLQVLKSKDHTSIQQAKVTLAGLHANISELTANQLSAR